MRNLNDLTSDELEDWLQAEGEKPFHAQQLKEWMWSKFVFDWDKITNLSNALKDKLRKAFRLSSLELVRVQESNDMETTKFLWKLHDGSLVESVLIRSGSRRTVC